MFTLYGYFVFDQGGKFSEMAKFRVFLLCCNESIQYLFILFYFLMQSSSISVILNTISNHTDRTKNMTSMTNLITVQYM
jgi:hypothetical protein